MAVCHEGECKPSFLPRLADPGRHLRRPVSDPMSATGSSEEIQAAFRVGRDRIKQIVQDILAGHPHI